MKVPTFLRSAFGALLCALALSAAPAARAQLVFDVSLDTTPFIGHTAGDFYLFFTLTDGDVLSNSVTIDNFDFGGGSVIGSPTIFGDASGDLASSVSLADTQFLNDFSQQFSAGSSLSFRVTISTNYSGGVPDSFQFGFLDNDGNPLPMLSYSTYGTDAALIVDITGETPALDAFGSDPSMPPFVGGDPITLGAPTTTVVPPPVGAVPEPSTYGLFATVALLGVVALRRKMAKK